MKLLSMKKKIIIGNWKMNLDFESSNYLIQEIISKSGNINVNIGIAPSFILLDEAIKNTKRSKIKVFAQNLSEYKSGAYTGEVSLLCCFQLELKMLLLVIQRGEAFLMKTTQFLKIKWKMHYYII